MRDHERHTELGEWLLQLADDLNYLQELISAVGRESSLNPTLNAVVEAFNRRRFYNRFKTSGKNVELDILLNQSTQSSKDDELCIQRASKNSPRLRFAFQRGRCYKTNCTYQHRCSLCWTTTHSASCCPQMRSLDNTVKGETSNQQTRRTNYQRGDVRPQHPRYRRDRAFNRRVPWRYYIKSIRKFFD